MACPTGYFALVSDSLCVPLGTNVPCFYRNMSCFSNFTCALDVFSDLTCCAHFCVTAVVVAPCLATRNARHGARADGYVMPKILPDFDSCDRGARCPGSLEKLERRADDTEDVIRER